MTDPMPTIREQLSAPLIWDANLVREESRETLGEPVTPFLDRARADGLAPGDLKPERIDIAPPGRRHAEDAEQLLADARELAELQYKSPRQLVAIAHVEATLALAEQHRIANVIAWQALTGESYRQEIRRDLFG